MDELEMTAKDARDVLRKLIELLKAQADDDIDVAIMQLATAENICSYIFERAGK